MRIFNYLLTRAHHDIASSFVVIALRQWTEAGGLWSFTNPPRREYCNDILDPDRGEREDEEWSG